MPERGTHGLLRQGTHRAGQRGSVPGHADHGVLHACGPSLLLRTGRRLHPLRRLPLRRPRSDPSQPTHADVRDDRPRRHRWWTDRHDGKRPVRALQRALAHHAGGPRGRGGELEVLRAARHALHHRHHAQGGLHHRQRAALLLPVREPELLAVPEGLPAHLPRRLRVRRPERNTSERQLDVHPGRVRRASSGPFLPRRVVHRSGPRDVGLQSRGVVADGALPHVRRERRVLRSRRATGGTGRARQGST